MEFIFYPPDFAQAGSRSGHFLMTRTHAHRFGARENSLLSILATMSCSQMRCLSESGVRPARQRFDELRVAGRLYRGHGESRAKLAQQRRATDDPAARRLSLRI
jgi:hypothetical protein